MSNLIQYNFGTKEDDNGYLIPSVTQSDSGEWVKFADVVAMLKTPTYQTIADMHRIISDMINQVADLNQKYLSLQRTIQSINTINTL